MKKRPFITLVNLLSAIEATDSNHRSIDCHEALTRVVRAVMSCCQKGNKVLFIGNGGSASIASHMATDFLKNLNIPALAFNDGSLLTCLSNDLGYERTFATPIKILANKGDMLFAISSSGRSDNILKAVAQARKNGCLVICLSGFSSRNPLRRKGDVNFYAPSSSYGDVEIAHLAICHTITDILYSR